MEIKYQLFKWDDTDEIIDIILKLWQLDKLCNSYQSGLNLSKVYFLDVLKEATDIYVAKDSDKVIGMLVLSIKNKEKIVIDKQIKSKLEIENCKEAKDFALMIENYHHNCNEMLIQSKQTFDGEIILFAVSDDYQHLGIGTSLFNLALKVFKKNNCSRYYLYTDTSCNYHYYDYLKMKRLFSLKDNHRINFTLFLYGGKVNGIS